MRKNAFTLIELLAIIALIATPIILGIIKDTKEQANKRSIEMYANAVKNALAIYELKAKENATSFVDIEKYIEYDGNVVCNIKEIYEDASIYLSACTVNNEPVKYTYGKKQFQVGKFDSVCTSVSGVNDTKIGSKYNCKVDPKKDEYTFFILSYNDKDGNVIRDESQAETINLIMDSNIRINGESVKEEEPTVEQKGLVRWQTTGGNAAGPVVAMKYLYEATINWTNVLPINYIYKDREFQGITTEDRGYESFESINGVASINGIQFTEEKMLRARMPIYSSDTQKTEVSKKNNENVYLYDYLLDKGIQTNKVNGVLGYWTLSSTTGHGGRACVVYCTGIINANYAVGSLNDIGVRPVITLDI